MGFDVGQESVDSSRRSFVGGVIASVGAASVLGATSASAATTGPAPDDGWAAAGPAAPERGEPAPTGTLLDALVGQDVRDCRVERVAVDHLGGAAIVLTGPEGRFQIDVLARDGEGIAQTERYSLYLANRGDGRRATVERHGLALMDIADWLRTREGTGEPLARMTHRERQAAHPRGNFLVP